MPPAAPVVQNLQDIVAANTAAQAPQQQELDDEEAQNEQSGSTATSGIDAAKTTAFTGIANAANARGATFSGFTPNAEAGYVGATYLPALAKLQDTIQTTRNTILGNKAALTTSANTAALGTQKDEQTALDTYNEQQAEDAATLQRQQEAETATAKEDELNRQAQEEEAAQPSATDTAAAQLAALNATYKTAITTKGAQGKDGYVSPTTYNHLLASYEGDGGTAAGFKAAFSGYANPNQVKVNPNDLYQGF